MHNWSTDTKILAKNKEKYIVWKLEQMINFGLCGRKIKESDLKKYWSKLNIDPERKKVLQILLNVENNSK